MCSCAFTHLVYALPYFDHLLVVFMVLQMQQESCRMLSAGQTGQTDWTDYKCGYRGIALQLMSDDNICLAIYWLRST